MEKKQITPEIESGIKSAMEELLGYVWVTFAYSSEQKPTRTDTYLYDLVRVYCNYM